MHRLSIYYLLFNNQSADALCLSATWPYLYGHGSLRLHMQETACGLMKLGEFMEKPARPLRRRGQQGGKLEKVHQVIGANFRLLLAAEICEIPGSPLQSPPPSPNQESGDGPRKWWRLNWAKELTLKVTGENPLTPTWAGHGQVWNTCSALSSPLHH